MDDKLYDVAIGALAKRDYSAKQLSMFLKSHGAEQSDIDLVISRLSKSNYINDQRVLDSAMNKYLLKQYGKSRIKQELKHKGFTDEDINQALESLDVDWLSMARNLKEKKFGLDKISDSKIKSKAIRYLQYKGHSMSDIITALG